jgi:predicted PurR-regulated permease PerM
MPASSESGESRNLELARQVLIVSSIVVLVGLVVVLIWFSLQILFLMFGGILLAIFIRGIAKWIARKTRLSRKWAISLVVLTIFLLAVLFSVAFGMQIYDQAMELTQELPGSLEQFHQMLSGNELGQLLLKAGPDLGKMFQQFLQNASSFFSSISGIVFSILFIFFLGIYLAYDPDLYVSGILQLFPSSKRPHIGQALNSMGFMLQWWLIGRLFSMGIIGLFTGIGLWVLGMPLAFTLGVFAGLISFIPYLGPILSFVPVVLLAATTGWNMVLYVVILYLAIQMLESYILTPIVLQRTVMVPPLLTLTAQVLFGMAAGVVGIVFALPITAMLIVLIKFFYIQDILGEDINVEGVG